MIELGLLLQACEKAHPDLAALLHVAATTGACRGELCGLRCGDVDLEGGTLTISRSISDAGSEVDVKDTKTHPARRLALDGQYGDMDDIPRRGKRPNGGSVEPGTCAFWHEDEGCGAVAVPGRPGVGFTHFSFIQGTGHRYLVPGEPVEMVWGSGRGQDGCDWLAASVRPVDRDSPG